jgi:hypothetical protein
MTSHSSPTPEALRREHFRLHFYGAVLGLLARTCGSAEARDRLLSQHAFLASYNDELAEHGLDGVPIEQAAAAWAEAIGDWELDVGVHLPLRALERDGLDRASVRMLVTLGLVEEDARFAAVLAQAFGLGAWGRPSVGAFVAWWSEDTEAGRRALGALIERALVRVGNASAPRSEWLLECPHAVWDLVRGDRPLAVAPQAQLIAESELPELETLVLSPELRGTIERVSTLLQRGELRAVLLRGPRRNGRKSPGAPAGRRAGRAHRARAAGALRRSLCRRGLLARRRRGGGARALRERHPLDAQQRGAGVSVASRVG